MNGSNSISSSALKTKVRTLKPIVEISSLKKTYMMGKIPVSAIDGIDLTIYPGELALIVGRSGSGKTTLLNMLGALDQPTSGNVLIDGIDIGTLNNSEMAYLRSLKIGFVFQFFGLSGHLTALENVELPMVPLNVNSSERRERSIKLLNMVDLESRIYHKPSELSGGQQQRVAIARSLVNNPKIVLMDEPTGNLDSKTSNQIVDFILTLNKKNNQTFILVTHSVELFEEYATHVIKLADGKIEEEFRK